MVYRLEYSCYDCPRIDINADEIEDKLPNGRKDMIDGISRKLVWHELNGSYYYEPDIPGKLPCPDLSEWSCDFVLSEKAKELLKPHIGKYGEFLPVNIEGDKRYYFNLLNTTDAIDPFNSEKEIFEGVEMGVKKIAFLEHKVKDLLLFNTPYDGYSYLYCTEEFKNLIEDSGLSSGWMFHEKLRDLEPAG